MTRWTLWILVALVSVAGAVNAAPIEREPTDLNFGTIDVGQSSTSSALLTNPEEPGEDADKLVSIGIEDDAEDSFFISYNGCPATNVLIDGQICEIKITFAPSGLPRGTTRVAGSLRVESSDEVDASSNGDGSDQSPNSVSYVALNAIARNAATQRIVILPGTTVFNNVPTNQSETRTVRFQNNSDGAVVFRDIEALEERANGQSSDSYSAEYKTCRQTLKSDEVCAINVTFEPDEQGTILGVLNITAEVDPADNNTDEPKTITARLVGTGTQSELGQPNLSPADVDFGALTAGQARTRSLTLRNTGNNEFTVSGLSLDQTGTFEITDNGCRTATIATDETCVIDVRFAPQMAGDFDTTLTVNAGSISTSATLSGSGKAKGAAVPEFTTDDLAFGEVAAGQIATKTLKLRNTGGQALSIPENGISIQGGGFSLASESCQSMLEAALSCSITIEFAPGASAIADGGDVVGVLSVTTDVGSVAADLMAQATVDTSDGIEPSGVGGGSGGGCVLNNGRRAPGLAMPLLLLVAVTLVLRRRRGQRDASGAHTNN